MTVPAPEPGNTETKEESFLKDMEVLRRAEAAAAAATAVAEAAAVASEPKLYRRAFTDITYATGYTSASGGQLQYAVIGNQIFIRGGAHRTAGDFTSGTEHVVGTVPAATPDADAKPLRPLQNHRYANWGSLGRIGRVEIQPDGDIVVKVPDNDSSEATTETNIVGVSGDTPHSHDVDMEQPFQWLGLSTTYLVI